MSILGTYSPPGGGPPYGGSASAESWSTLDDLLVPLADNTSNAIVAKYVRDSVFTLWDRIDIVSVIAGSAASASAFFQNTDPTPVTVGGISAGTTFPIPTNMQDMWNDLLYPYIPPAAGFGALGSREYGQSTSVSLSWIATKNSNLITTIIVDSVAQVVSGNTQVGVKTAIGSYSPTPPSSQINTFNMSVGDGTSTTNASVNLTWMNRRYWGKIDLSSIGNPNLTTNPGSASLAASLCTDNAIKALTGANANAQAFGNEKSTTKNKTYNNIDGGGDYLIFAWPTSVSGSLTPTFIVNGLPSTAFTRVRTVSAFLNNYSFSGSNYEVWISNTLQSSPLNIIVS